MRLDVKAEPSPAAQRKAARKRTDPTDGEPLPVHSFHTLLGDLATLTRMSSASAAITSPPSSPPLPAHSTTPSICSGLPPPRRQTDTTAAKLYQWLALKRGQSSG
jgi:hypothetical protein